MIYRAGRVDDLPQITSMLCRSGYYMATDAAQLGGAWVVAEYEGELVGCVWAFAQAPNAFIDYLYVEPRFRNGRIALVLMRQMEIALRRAGVKYVRATVKSDNKDAGRLVNLLGMWTDGGYDLGYKEIG